MYPISKAVAFVLLCAALVALVSGAVPANVCLRKLGKFCRLVVAEQCQPTSATQTFRALADCCSGQCSREELIQSCCF